MASFAKIGLNNRVMQVLSVHNNELLDSDGVEQEKLGIQFLTTLFGWAIWRQTSYNTRGGVHLLGGTPFRKNFAGIGHIYDEDREAFIEKQPFDSWTLNETTCLWEAPTPRPDDGKKYIWNELTKSWDEVV